MGWVGEKLPSLKGEEEAVEAPPKKMRKHRPTGEKEREHLENVKCPHNKNGKEKGESDSAVCK